MSLQDPAPTLEAEQTFILQPAYSPLRMVLHRFLRHRAAVVSAIFLALLVLACVCAPLFEAWLGTTFADQDLFGRYAAPSAAHPLGQDEIGRDVLIRLLYGGRVSLLVGVSAALCSALIGSLVGLLAGFYGGRLDALLMRFTDGVIALPILPFLIILSAIDLKKLGVPQTIALSDEVSLYRIVIVVSLFGWTTVARLVRGGALSVRQREYVRAALALGASNARIMRVHVLPNVVSPIVVAVTLSIGHLILVESTLSYLGVGIQLPLPSWGNMLVNAQDLIYSAPLLAIYPGLMIFLTVIAFNFLGDGLQDALDPRAGSQKK